jgi:tRNA-2-methylthio-N6-dimethylallyladenosine synthase
MRYYLMTLGCQMNLSDGERVHTVLNEMGCREVQQDSDADIVGIIACSVRQKAIDKVYNQIARWNREKNRRTLLTFLSGCILPEDRERFLKLFDLVFPMSEVLSLPEMIRSFGVVTPASLKLPEKKPDRKEFTHTGKGIPVNENIFSLWNIRPDYQSEFEAFVPIQNGCNKFCTFCAVPYTRGKEVSRPSEEILEQVRELIDRDYKSITLLGQNVNSYGLDKSGREISFAELLEKVGELARGAGKENWIYYTSPHPRDMNEEVFDVMATYSNLAGQVHLPMQSGDDRILVRMNRNHTMDRYRELVRQIREKLPAATLFTDIITGFAGETDEQHKNTMEAMEEFRFNMAYIAQYSPRPGAASYRWGDSVPKEVKKERFHQLNEILEKTASEHNKDRIGRVERVLVTGPDRKPGYMKGLTEGKINVRFPSSPAGKTGTFADVRISGSNGMSLEGKLLQVKIESLAVDG